MAEEIKESQRFINLGVVLNDKGEVLMIRRVKEEIGSDGSILRWAFPGGKQRVGESRNECVKREVQAETGYEIEPLSEISLRFHPQFMVMVAYHICRLLHSKQTTEPIEVHEVAEIKWFKPQDIPKLVTTNLGPNVKKELRIA